MHRLTALVLPALVLQATACSPSIQSASFGPTLQPTRMADVRVYSTQQPACAYRELGIVAGPATDLFTSLQSIVDGMRSRAAAMGGDALVQFRPAGEPAGAERADASSRSSGFIATVVRFDGACPDSAG
jgi:hypothetical protein